jgi:hypothetical protein
MTWAFAGPNYPAKRRAKIAVRRYKIGSGEEKSEAGHALSARFFSY